MPPASPQPDAPPAPAFDADRMLALLDSLKRCRGWTEWIHPMMHNPYQQARTDILEAIAAGQPVPEVAASTYRAFHPIFELIQYQEARASAPAPAPANPRPSLS